MPHAFWHQWGDERTEQERLQAAALERIANLDEFGTTDPSIWDKYVVRDPLAGGERRLDRAGQALGQVASGLGAIMDPVSERLFKPMMGEVARDIPVTWTPEGDVPTPWTEQIGLTQDDSPTSVGGAFKEFVRDAPISPFGLSLGSGIAPVEEAINRQILPRADTTREQRVSQEATKRQEETGVPVTQKERREISQELYPLPPYVLGTLEEAPWFAVPEAGLARGGLAAARMGKALSSAGRLGPAAPAARGALRVAEAGLKPIEAVETIAAKTIGAPIQLLGKGARFGLSPINRRLTESRLKQSADQVNEMIDIESSGSGGRANLYDTDTGELVKGHTPKEGLDALNQMVSLRLGIDKPLFHLVGNKVTRNPLEKLPTNVNMNWQPNAKSEAAFDRLFPRLSEEEIAQRMRRPVRTEPDNLPEPVTNQEMVPESTVKQLEPWEQTKEQFRKPSGEDYRGETEAYIRNRTNSNNPQELLAWYQQRYPELRGVTIGGLQATRESGPLVNEGVTRIIRDNGKFNPAETQIHLTQDADLVVTRHEIEHLLDAIHGFADEGQQAFGRYGHEEFNASDYLHRSLVRDAVEEGLPVPESVLRDYPDLAARQTPTEAAIESPVTVDVMGGRSREVIPSPTEAQPAATAARRAATESGQTHQAIEDVGRSGVLSSKVDDIGGAEQVALETKGLSPGAADFYVKLMFSMHDSTFALRVLQDNYFRSINPQASFRPGSHRDVVAGVILSSGAPIRGMRFYENFIKNTIEPKLGRTKEEIAAGVETSVEQWHIERYIQSKHWLDIENNIGRENMPNVYDPRPKLDADGNPTKEVIGEVSSENYKLWIDDIEKIFEKTPEQFARVVEGARAVRDVYARMRVQLRDEGIISNEQFIAMQDNYEWYNPIDYVEFNDATQVARNMPIINTGIYGFSDNPAVMQAMPPLGETLARRFISHELRIHRNRVNKAFVEMGLNSNIGLVDMTNELSQVTSFRRYLDKEGNWQEAPVFGKAESLYDDKAGTGYLSFYENGERKLFGMKDAKGKTGFVDKVWWDAVNGRAGLGVRGNHEVENIFALSNSFFKATYTTFDPLFMLGNGLIDQLVVALKYRVMPTTVWWRLVSSIYRNMPALGVPRTGLKTPAISGREGAQVLDFKAFASGDIKGGFVIGSEDRFRELMQLSGGYQNAYFNAQQISRQIQREINKAGHVGAEVIQPTQMTKLRDSLADGARKYFPVPLVGEYVEQAPRLLVGQKSFKKLIGNKEWKRLMKLSRDEWEEVLYRNWNDTGKGLVDSPEARQASINALESTINFFRGGDRIRRWNNYVMFLNAAFEGSKLPFRMLGVDIHPNLQPVEGARAGERLFEFGDWRNQLGRRRGQTGKYDAPLGPEIMGKQLDPRLAAATTVGMAVSSYAGLQLAYNFQHEEYWDIPTYIRYNSIIIMQPAERDEDGNKIVDPNTGRPVPNYITVPHRTRELSLFFGTTAYLLESGFTENPTDWTLFAKQIWKSSSPVSDAPLPELLNIGIEEVAGYDLYRMEPIVNEDYAHLPPEEQYNQYTSEAARIIGNRLGESLPWAPDMAKSPQRLEHMYESATGGIGRRVKDGTDYTILLLEDLFKNEQKPMSEKAGNYRKMPRLERREFLASLTPEERIQFDKEIRKPSADFEGSAVTNILDAVWASTGVEQRFGPDRAGGLREISQLSAEREIPGVTAKESSAASSKLRQVKREVFATQQENDKNLGQWMQAGGMSGLSPEEWREERKAKWKVIEGAELLTRYTFPKAVQGKDPAIKQQWYDAIYNAAGTMPDIRSQADLLVAGYYNITSPDDDTARTWSDYFNDRDAYVASIQERADAAGDPNIFEEFNRALTANLTDTETVYNTASKYLSNYWDIGSDINHILPNATATAPELAQLWESYLNADYGTQRTMRDRNRQLDTLVQRRSQIRKQVVMDDYQQNGYGYMDSLLAFWYGSFYQPITPQGKEIHSQMYGGAGSSRLPVTPQEQPLRLR